MEKITIALDAMGGDNAPQVVLEGCEMALKEYPRLNIILCGTEEVVVPFCETHDRCEPCVCTEVIAMDDHPVQAVRSKTDSSMVRGAQLVKNGVAQGFFSAGSTGATMAVGTLIIGRIKGVQRPGLCTVLPSPVKPVVLCDVGANADCKPAYLVQFAKMASLYMEKVMRVPNPGVHLLNIGEEEVKGSSFAIECHQLLKEKVSNFKGNCEGRDLLTGDCDVVVTDGFTGNVALKTIEGVGDVLFSALKETFMSSFKGKMGALLLKDGMKDIKDKVSADTYGAAPILGVKAPCMVGHGSIKPQGVMSGIGTTIATIESGVAGLIAEAIAAEKEED